MGIQPKISGHCHRAHQATSGESFVFEAGGETLASFFRFVCIVPGGQFDLTTVDTTLLIDIIEVALGTRLQVVSPLLRPTRQWQACAYRYFTVSNSGCLLATRERRAGGLRIGTFKREQCR